MKGNGKRLITIFVAIGMCFQLGSVSASTPTVQSEANHQITEDTSLRNSHTKHFIKEDGSYIAAYYGEPIHYRSDSGEWRDIDNTLKAVDISKDLLEERTFSAYNYWTMEETASSFHPLSVNQKAAYMENTENPFKVRLPEKLMVNSPIMISHEGYTLGFQIQEPMETKASVSPDESLFEIQQKLSAAESLWTNVETKAALRQEVALMLPRQTAEIVYDGVYPDVRLDYRISGQTLKESIILDAPSSHDSFSFHLIHTGLTPILQSNGSVYFYKEDGGSKPVFMIAAPFMYDSGDSISTDIAVSLTLMENGSLYTLTPDSAWLHNGERVYPVTLDPTIKTTSQEARDIEDNGVNEFNPTSNYLTTDRIYVGSNLSGSKAYESRMYVRLPLIAEIPATAYINNATLVLNHYPTSSYQSAVENRFDLYDVGENGWGDDITWNSQKDYKFGTMVTSTVSDKSRTVENWDITSLARKWYAASSRYNGFVIKPRIKDGSRTNRTCYASSDISVSNKPLRPMARITYTLSGAGPTEGVYFIKNVNSGKYLDAYNTMDNSVVQYQYHGNPNHQWYVHQGTDGYYRIETIYQPYMDSGRKMLSCGETASYVDLWHENTALKTQQYRILPNGDGSYRILNHFHMDKKSPYFALGVRAASLANLAKVDLVNYTGANSQSWVFERVNFGNGGEYRPVESREPNCFGYALFLSKSTGPTFYLWDTATDTESYSKKFENEIKKYVVSCKRIESYSTPIAADEYRIAVRAPRSNGYNYHVIYQLSDGTWAGKDDIRSSKRFGRGNPSTSPEMWSNDAYPASAGTIYFAVKRW